MIERMVEMNAWQCNRCGYRWSAQGWPNGPDRHVCGQTDQIFQGNALSRYSKTDPHYYNENFMERCNCKSCMDAAKYAYEVRQELAVQAGCNARKSQPDSTVITGIGTPIQPLTTKQLEELLEASTVLKKGDFDAQKTGGAKAYVPPPQPPVVVDDTEAN